MRLASMVDLRMQPLSIGGGGRLPLPKVVAILGVDTAGRIEATSNFGAAAAGD